MCQSYLLFLAPKCSSKSHLDNTALTSAFLSRFISLNSCILFLPEVFCLLHISQFINLRSTSFHTILTNRCDASYYINYFKVSNYILSSCNKKIQIICAELYLSIGCNSSIFSTFIIGRLKFGFTARYLVMSKKRLVS